MTRMLRPVLAAASAVRPTDATSGSVNVTCGTAVVVGGGDVPSPRPVVDRVGRRARAAITSPAARAWYLP